MDDAPFLYALYASTRAAEMARVGWDDAQKVAFLRTQFDLQRLQYRRAYPDATFQIIVLAGRAAGRLYIHRGAHDIRVIDISLLPEYRHLGIGTRLLGALLADADRLGLPVSLHVERENPARRLYARLGFRLVEDRSVYLLMEWRSPQSESLKNASDNFTNPGGLRSA